MTAAGVCPARDGLMLALRLGGSSNRHLRVLALGAHPDDIEIGAGATLLQLAGSCSLTATYVILTGTPERQVEARNAAHAFLPGVGPDVHVYDLPEGRLPAHWVAVKDILEGVATDFVPDLVLAPSPNDAHQDHRTLATIVPTVFRDALYLAYEIPKWDGDTWRTSTYVPMSTETARRKVALLFECFPSQHDRDWWDEEVFLGRARLRGVECKSTYAEAFGCDKAILSIQATTD